MESFCLLSLNKRFEIKEFLIDVLKNSLFESSGLSITIEAGTFFDVKGKFITSEKPFLTKKIQLMMSYLFYYSV